MTPEALIAVMEATWPPASQRRLGPVTLREGQGGGQRVSAASLAGAWTDADLDAADAAMRAMGQRPLYLVTPGQGALDAALARRGFAVKDPVVGYAAPAAALARPLPPLAAFPHWPLLEIDRQIWAENGIGAGRIAVMERVEGPKTAILSRSDGRPSGLAFAACAGTSAMLHALVVRPERRRQGAARHLMVAAAAWAAANHAQELAVVVTEANAPARALYRDLGMASVSGYHYRVEGSGQIQA